MTTARFGKLALQVTLAASFASLVGCAAPVEEEAQGSVTSKQLAPYEAVNTPASVTADFVEALGGVPVEIDGWRGYVAGTIDDGDEDDALFAIHLSGVKGTKPVAGLTIALVEGADVSDDLEERLETAQTLEVRFNNGSGLVSRHVFDTNTTTASHEDDPESKALLERAFNDANAILQAPVEVTKEGDASKACLSNYLMLAQHAARCVDSSDPGDCGEVRKAAVATAATCAGSDTANVLATAPAARSAGGVTTQNILGGLLGGFLGKFFPIAQAGTSGSNPLVSIVKGLLGSFSGGGSGGGGLIQSLFGSIFGGGSGTAAKSIPATKFGQPGTPKASSTNGKVTVPKVASGGLKCSSGFVVEGGVCVHELKNRSCNRTENGAIVNGVVNAQGNCIAGTPKK